MHSDEGGSINIAAVASQCQRKQTTPVEWAAASGCHCHWCCLATPTASWPVSNYAHSLNGLQICCKLCGNWTSHAPRNPRLRTRVQSGQRLWSLPPAPLRLIEQQVLARCDMCRSDCNWISLAAQTHMQSGPPIVAAPAAAAAADVVCCLYPNWR